MSEDQTIECLMALIIFLMIAAVAAVVSGAIAGLDSQNMNWGWAMTALGVIASAAFFWGCLMKIFGKEKQ